MKIIICSKKYQNKRLNNRYVKEHYYASIDLHLNIDFKWPFAYDSAWRCQGLMHTI